MARAGVMFRNSLSANSRHVMMAITPGSGADFQSRSSDGGSASDNTYSGYSAPYWVKLVREGSQFSGYVSGDGTTWTLVRQVNVSMGTNIHVGLAVSSSGYGASNTSTFSNVAVTRTDHSLPGGWSDQDLGSASFAGSARFYNNTFTFAVESSGQNVGGTSDAFHFAHRTLIGDGEMIARVSAVQTGYALAKAGIMFRDGMTDSAKNVFLAISAGNGAVWQHRDTAAGNTNETWVSGKAAPYWVRIVRSGNSFTGYLSTDGSTWNQIGSTVTISGMSSSLEVGLALSAAGYGSLNTSTFDNVKMIPAVPTLTVTPVHAHQISLAWTDNSGSESGFILQRSSDGGATWTQLGNGDIHASGYVDSDVTPGTTYSYRVKAFIDDIVRGETNWSGVVTSSTTGLGDGLSATYFDSVDFSGATATRIDPSINFHWIAGQSPADGIAANSFAVEWKGQILAPASGAYTFSTLSDDGMRLWVNDQIVIEHWNVHDPATDAGTITLTAGQKYNLRLEYFQNFYSADAYLSWIVPGSTSPVSVPTANLFSTGFNSSAAPSAPSDVTGGAPATTDALTNTRVDVSWTAVTGAVRYDIYRSWDDGSCWQLAGSVASTLTHFTDTDQGRHLDSTKLYAYRVAAIGAGGRSAGTDLIKPPSNFAATITGSYNTLTWTADASDKSHWRIERSTDGGQTWIGRGNADASWATFPDTRDEGENVTYLYRMRGEGSLTTGLYSDGTAALSPAPYTPLKVQYYDNTALYGTATEDIWDYSGDSGFKWGRNPLAAAGVPDSEAPPLKFSARISGRITAPVAGNYTFYTVADGGVRLLIDAQTQFEDWQDVPNLDGDADRNGAVDFKDLTAVAQHYGDSTQQWTWEEGDFTGDGSVGFADLVKLAQNYNGKQQARTYPDRATSTAGVVHLTAGQVIRFTLEFFNDTAAASVDLRWVRPAIPGQGETAPKDESIPQSYISPPEAAPGQVTLSGSNSTISEGGSIPVTLSANVSGDTVDHWIVHGLQDITVVGNPVTTNVPFTSKGTYLITADAVGRSGLYYPATSNVTVTVNNAAPTITTASADRTSVNEGDEVNLHAAATDPGADDVLQYSWKVIKNGYTAVPFATGFTQDFSFRPDDEGTYAATVTVPDGAGGSASSQPITVTATNVNPTADPGSAQTVNEGDTVTLVGYATDAGISDALNYNWHITAPNGQQISDGNTSRFSFIPDDNGDYDAALTVTDGDGGSDVKHDTVHVNNVAPVIDDESDIAGPSTYGSFRINDAAHDSFTYGVNYGDGKPDTIGSGDNISMYHNYYEDGQNNYHVRTYTATVTATDDDGGSTSIQHGYTVGYANDFQTGRNDGFSSSVSDYNGFKYLGPFGSGASPSLSLTNLPTHQTLWVQLRFYRLGSWAKSEGNISQLHFTVDGRDATVIGPYNGVFTAGASYDPAFGTVSGGGTTLNFAIVHSGSSANIQFSVPGLTSGNGQDGPDMFASDDAFASVGQSRLQLEHAETFSWPQRAGLLDPKGNIPVTSVNTSFDSQPQTSLDIRVPGSWTDSPAGTLYTLSVNEAGANQVSVWSNVSNHSLLLGAPTIGATPVRQFTFTSNTFPGGLAVYGLTPSSATGQLQFTLQVTGPDGFSAAPIVFNAQVLGADLDVDSDNNNQLNAPDRSDSENAVEDTPGQDSTPGKVLLVNDGDLDDDGYQGFVDGFNADGIAGNADDVDTSAKFVPLVLDLGAVPLNPNYRIHVDYDASDPKALRAGSPAPGHLRIWLRDGMEPRDKRSVVNGGDFVAPGDYTPSQLGFSGGQPVTLYVEAVQTSSTVADLPVKITASPEGAEGLARYGIFAPFSTNVIDQVRFTATRIELLGRGYGDTAFTSSYTFVPSSLSAPPQNGDTVGPFMVHKLRVTDPRHSGLSQITVDGQTLPLTQVNGQWESSEFVLTDSTAAQNWSVSQAKVPVSPTADLLEIAYNPKKSSPQLKLGDLPEHLRTKTIVDMDKQTQAIGKTLKADLEANGANSWVKNWNAPDSGKYGKELDKQLKAWAALQPKIQTDVYVNVRTKKIEWIGAAPPAGVANNASIQQVDLVKVKDDKPNFQVGDQWDLSKIESVHEVKTSSQNRFEGRQKERYFALTNNGEKLHVLFTQYTYSQIGNNMVINNRYVARWKVLSAVGLGFTAAVGTVWAARLDQFDEFMRISDDTIGWTAKAAKGNLSQADHGTYAHKVSTWTVAMNSFVQDLLPPDVNFDGSQLVAYTILEQMLSSYGVIQ